MEPDGTVPARPSADANDIIAVLGQKFAAAHVDEIVAFLNWQADERELLRLRALVVEQEAEIEGLHARVAELERASEAVPGEE